MLKILLSILLLISIPSIAHAEYNLATEENELILVSTEKEIEMGKNISKNVEKRFKLANDELLQQKIDGIGQDIARVCDRKDISYYFRVLAGEDLKPEQRINAFSLPGGYVYIFKDLVQKLEDDDEIAAVLAHEVGHIAAKHSVKRLQGSLGMMALRILTSRIESEPETRGRANAAINLLMMDYSREDEFLADKLAVKYTRLAGYDPEGNIKVIDMLIETQRKGPIRPYIGYRTHPYLAERKAMISKEISGHMAFDDFINMPE
jgi:predicted Zn-dependent protease